MSPKTQRVRCVVHNLIQFDERDQLEHALWDAVQTPAFQRLRRVRQLGFSDLVFPGATHTRFAHSLGVFHVARMLTEVIEREIGRAHDRRDRRADVALAAALLHDVGHGMFSHALEAVGKTLKLPMEKHEAVSAELIRNSEIREALKPLGGSFADEVADLIARKLPANIYDAVVSSQFDADRLDYMQRDRLMTGIRSSEVDPVWLLANLEVAEVAVGADRDKSGTIQTLVLGPKAARAAENYLLSLFHLYPNVYLHKATRGAEAAFQALLRRLFHLRDAGCLQNSGLPGKHALLRFVTDPGAIQNQQALDDGVFWSSLPMLAEARDAETKRLAASLAGRKLLRCIDVNAVVEGDLSRKAREKPLDATWLARVRLVSNNIKQALEEGTRDTAFAWRVFVDAYSRSPYERYQDSKTPLNRIYVKGPSGALRDMSDFSHVIAAAQPFDICRAYVFRDDVEACDLVENKIRTEIEGMNNGAA